MVDQRTPVVELGMLSLYLLSRPLYWTAAAAAYIGTLLFPSSATATKKQHDKTAAESAKLRLELQTQVETCQVRITLAQRRRDEMLASAVAAKRSGDSKQALSCMHKVQEQRKMLDFLEGVQRSTENQMAAVERTEMTKDIMAGQEQVAKVMGKQKFADQIDEAEDYKATMEEIAEDGDELCGILAAGAPGSDEDDLLMDELVDIELGDVDGLLATVAEPVAVERAAEPEPEPRAPAQPAVEPPEQSTALDERVALLAQ
jgi:hypothetical protein